MTLFAVTTECLEAVDEGVGRLLDYLDESGLAEWSFPRRRESIQEQLDSCLRGNVDWVPHIIMNKMPQARRMRRRRARLEFFRHVACCAVLLIMDHCARAHQVAEAELVVDGLRCEYQVNPLGIDQRRPRLSWRMTSHSRGQEQTAYQVQVASSPERLADERIDLWDSGKIVSSRQLGVSYQGQPLECGQRCWWHLRVWDKQGRPSLWSEPAWWERGPLDPSEWQAQWIGDGKPLPEIEEEFYRNDPAPMMRKTFRIERPVRQARLYIAGLGYYEASLNGRRIGDRLLDPGWTTYDKRVLFSTYDVTSLLADGENVLAAMLGNGWYNPLPLHMWGRINIRDHLRVGRPRLIAQLVIDYADGSRKIVITDPTWKVASGPIVRNSIFLGETYDARRELPGWNRPGFDDATWQAAVVCKENLGPLQTQFQPPIKAIGKCKPERVTEPLPGVYLFDMGQNFAGWVRLRVRGPAGTVVKLRYGELLHDDGSLNVMTSVCGQIKRAGLGGPGAPPLAYQGDTYILRGEDIETYTPRFTFHAFRYVEVSGFPGVPTPDAVEGMMLSADVEDVGTFACSHQLLNRLQTVCRRTFRSNLFSVQSDCPHRERFGYGGDIVASSEALMLNYDMSQFYAKSVIDFADAVRPNGGLPETAPYVGISAGGFGDRSGPIGWAIVHPLLICQLRQYYGDDRLLAEQYDVAVRWLRLVERQSPNHLVGRGIGDHESVQPTSHEVTGTAFYYQAARLVARLARQRGKADDSRRFEALAQKIRHAFVREFLDPETGKIRAGTQTAQAAALYHGLLPDETESLAFDRLVDVIEDQDGHLSSGIFGTKYTLDVLPRHGRPDLAFKIATQEDFPGWGYMLERGASTLWEHWQFSDNTFSHNHPMFGSVSEWMFRHVAGINVADDANGCDRIEIRPQVIGDLTWAKARYCSIRGPIESSWSIDGEKLTLLVDVPVGAVAEVYLPTQNADGLTESGHPIDRVRDVRVTGAEGGAVRCQVRSGRYVFAAPWPANGS